ncbi:MAG: type II toxin-antitoxin system CcdA family antitoxin [Candidatus Verstraetearchaeota archaeon]|nr:type II toxin-antitoxin system CcdA family antitoxin [Candidatus Verstraetearchaeota archaeon]
MEYITVSAKVKRDLYEKIKKYKIPISSVIRKALEDEIRRREEEEMREKLAQAQIILKKISPEELVEAVRASREGR